VTIEWGDRNNDELRFNVQPSNTSTAAAAEPQGAPWNDGPIESTLSVGPWFARATGGDWAVFLDDVGAVRRGMRANRAENKAAILEELRELRVLNGGAK
jgi:hypothetical protein